MPNAMRERFATPYDEFRCHGGKRFEFLGEVNRDTFDYHEVGPMYHIRLETGEEIIAWPEEVYHLHDDAWKPL